MNTFNENLQTTVVGILSALDDEQTKQESAQTSAEYDLYYAQGGVITAQDNLDETIRHYDYASAVDTQGVENDNQATNVLTTATEADNNVAATVTDMSTAANNVQVAANAVTQLASDIGSAFSIVSAADFGTDIYARTRDLNSVMLTTAYQAEYCSQLSMEASTAAAEIISAEVKTDATTAQSEVENLLGVTTAQFDSISAQRSDDKDKVDAASKTEQAAEGALLDADAELLAITSSYACSNDELNYDLTVEVLTIDSIEVNIHDFNQPFGPSLDVPANSGKMAIPDAAPKYYITLVKDDAKDAFNLEQAEANFTDYLSSRFFEYSEGAQSLKGLKDSDGDEIKAGVDYVAFLYIELSLNYKKYLDAFDDILSAPSQEFTLTTVLNAAQNFSYINGTGKLNSHNIVEVDFDVTGDVASRAEQRVMFLAANTPALSDFKIDENCQKTSDVAFYFNKSIAEQVTAANYTLATRKSSKFDDAEITTTYKATVDDTTTDNFGNEIKAGQDYVVAVLSVVPDSNPEHARFTSSLSDLSIAPVVLKSRNILSQRDNSVGDKVDGDNDDQNKSDDE